MSWYLFWFIPFIFSSISQLFLPSYGLTKCLKNIPFYFIFFNYTALNYFYHHCFRDCNIYLLNISEIYFRRIYFLLDMKFEADRLFFFSFSSLKMEFSDFLTPIVSDQQVSCNSYHCFHLLNVLFLCGCFKLFLALDFSSLLYE